MSSFIHSYVYSLPKEGWVLSSTWERVRHWDINHRPFGLSKQTHSWKWRREDIFEKLFFFLSIFLSFSELTGSQLLFQILKLYFCVFFWGKFCPCSVVLGLARGSRVRYTEWVFSCIPFFCDPMDCSPLGSSVHENFQARILEWAATAYSREPSQTRIEPPSLAFPALQADSLPLSYLGRPILNEASLIQKETCPLATLLCKVLNRIPTLCDFFFLRPGMCRESPETPLYSETSLSFNSFLYPIFSIKLLVAKESTLWGLGSNEKQQEKEKRKPVRLLRF